MQWFCQKWLVKLLQLEEAGSTCFTKSSRASPIPWQWGSTSEVLLKPSSSLRVDTHPITSFLRLFSAMNADLCWGLRQHLHNTGSLFACFHLWVPSVSSYPSHSQLSFHFSSVEFCIELTKKSSNSSTCARKGSLILSLFSLVVL